MNKSIIIKNLIARINMNIRHPRNIKDTERLFRKLYKHMNELLSEDDTEFFQDLYSLAASPICKEYITKGFYKDKIDDIPNNIVEFSNHLSIELRWIFMSISLASPCISEFILKREKYDNCILLNKYIEANVIIDEVEEKYGPSYWSMESRLFVNNKLNKSNESIIQNIGESAAKVVLSFFDFKNNQNITYDDYYYVVDKAVEEAREDEGYKGQETEFIYYMISGGEFIYSDDKILEVIKSIQCCSIIDRYLFIIRIANEIIKDQEKDIFQIFKKYIPLLQGINDNHLRALMFVICDDPDTKGSQILNCRLNQAKDKFMEGDISQSREMVKKILEESPSNFDAMRMLTEISIFEDKSAEYFEGTNLGEIIRGLRSVYSLYSEENDAIEALIKLTLVCSMSTWSKYLISDVRGRYICPDDNGYKVFNILANLQYIGIETIIASRDAAIAIDYLADNCDIRGPYIDFCVAVLTKNYKKASGICKIDEINNLLYMCDNHSLEEKMEHLDPITGNKASFAVRSTIQFFHNIDLMENYQIIFQKSAELVVENIYTALLIPWEKIIDYVNNGPSYIRKEIYTPILYYVYTYYINKTCYDDLGVVCEDFLRLNNVEKPSEMECYFTKYNIQIVVFFLKYVCTAKTLDDAVYVFENTQERDKERVEICNHLIQIDSTNTKEYENEIREITQKLMINKELTSIDESRIHVNLEGIREKLCNSNGVLNRFDSNIKNDFQRLLLCRQISIRQWMETLHGQDNGLYRELHDTYIHLFKELIYRIRDAFVSSDEYGLNGYLSLNIRHNTLDDELRSPFYRTMLNVKKGSDAKYIYQKQWEKNATGKDKEILEKAFGDFYISTESILRKLKGQYIQIRTESKNEEGLFDYRLFDKDFEIIGEKTDETTDFNEFFDVVVDYLWKITENNLSCVKDKIMTEIFSEYGSALNRLSDDIRGISNSKIKKKIQQKTKEAETDVYNTLSRICYWFQRSNESKHNDFDIQFAFDLGLQTMIYMHPEKEFKAIEIEPTISDKIPGEYLKDYDGMFYNILDNIYKKASINQNDGTVEIRYSLYWKNGEGLRIYIENDYDCTCTSEMHDARNRVQNARNLLDSGDYIYKVTGEGGTGIPKIFKILTFDLNLEAKMEFGFKEEENKFYMDIMA